MGRRSDHSKEEIYEMALDAARRIVEEGGLTALTARKVADAIGYSPGTLYNHFANLDDMIIHLNGRTLDDMSKLLSESPITGDAQADLAELVDRYITFIKDQRNLWSAVFDHGLPAGQTVPDWYRAQVSAAMEIVEERLDSLFDNSQAEEKKRAARTLWAGVHGICTLSESGKLQVVAAESTESMARMLVRNFVAGLAYKKQTAK